MSYQSQTSPLALQAATASNGSEVSQTSPLSAQLSTANAAQVTAGMATKYWDELVAYPTGGARNLWLYVNNSWQRLENPSANIQDIVQRAFLGTDSKVRVWFDGGKIVGLAVEGN